MKRKTNLFYTTGPDSKFITFSNYTESLTGNFLSTDTKMYPSKFIALYIKGLNEETKPALIKYLASYYESKLAVIRDYYSENRADVENDVTPLNYLLEALLRIKGFELKPSNESDDSSSSSDIDSSNDSSSDDSSNEETNEYETDYVYSIKNNENPVVEFKYISEITEQDYNGTFADTICCIDLKNYATILPLTSSELNDDTDDNVVTFERPDTLYGWDDIPKDYKDCNTIPDSIGGIDLDEFITIVDSTYEYGGELPIDNSVNNGNLIHNASQENDTEHENPIEDIEEQQPLNDDNAETDIIDDNEPIDAEDTDDNEPTDTEEIEDTEYEVLPISEDNNNQEHKETNSSTKNVRYKIKDDVIENKENHPNIIDINTKISDISIDEQSSETSDTTLSDMINNIVSPTKTFGDALDEILHSQDEQSMIVQTAINNILSKQTEETAVGKRPTVLFYDIDEQGAIKDNIIYIYDGASITTINLQGNYEYHVTPEIKKLKLQRVNGSQTNNELEFNCIIPLYDIVNINYKSNFNTIERMIDAGESEIDLMPSPSNNMYITNVPLGMWLYTSGDVNEDDSTSIKLYYDSESGFSQSWSLTIASQFKPFPYSMKMPSDMLTNSNTNAYATFAQVLASQAAMVDKFLEISKEISEVHDHIRSIESQLNNMGTSYNIDNIHREFNNFEIGMNNKFNDLKNDVLNQISYLRWHTTI